MQRLIARLLLLVAFSGIFVPLGMAASAGTHACCIRAAHHCREGVANSTGPAFRAAGCCSGDCSRALTEAQWAHATPLALDLLLDFTNVGIQSQPSKAALSSSFELLPSRAPPSL